MKTNRQAASGYSARTLRCVSCFPRTVHLESTWNSPGGGGGTLILIQGGIFLCVEDAAYKAKD